MKFIIYWLISEDYKNTYIGFTSEINERLRKHRTGSVKSTKKFGKFKYIVLESVNDLYAARKREKYWKSHAGRKKLEKIFN